MTSKFLLETMKPLTHWSETSLNYEMMVERYPNLKEEVGGLTPGCEISVNLLSKEKEEEEETKTSTHHAEKMLCTIS